MKIGDKVKFKYTLSYGFGEGEILKIFKKDILVQPPKKGAPSFIPHPLRINKNMIVEPNK